MERLAFAVLLLLLEIVCRAHSASNGDPVVGGKASLVSGVVLPSRLGSGVANASTCPNGNSTWGSCGGGSPAGITYATTAQNWSQTLTTALTAGVSSSLMLRPCPTGVDTTSGFGYDVYISDRSNSEAVAVTGGTCTSGGSSGTITFTPYFSHAYYTIESASSGIQETINVACGTSTTYYANQQCNVTIPANGPESGSLHSLNTYKVYGTIFFHSSQSLLNGSGTSLNCEGRGPCLQVGDRVNSNHFPTNLIQGLTFRGAINNSSNVSYTGCAITNTSISSAVAMITTASACGFRPGDIVDIQFTDNPAYTGDALVTSASGTSFTFTKASYGSRSVASQATPGVVALAFEAVLDNGNGTHFMDIQSDFTGNYSFANFFDFWDDENALIEHFNNNGIGLYGGANWTGSFIYSGGGPWNSGQQWAPVITLRDSSITANYSNGVTVDNSNGVYIENTVIQASGPWQVKTSNIRGNYQGAYLKNIYSESSTALNPLSPQRSPFPGLGIAGLIVGMSSGAASFQIAGNGGTLGAFATGGTGSTPFSYFIVTNDTTAGMQTSPMQVLNWLSTGSDAIPVRWPRVANGNDAITYDVIRMTTPSGVGAVYPYNGGCLGGSGGACGYVAKGLLQSAACSGGLVCTYKDNGSSSTSAYTIKQGNYGGSLNFWPGSVVSVNKSVTVDVEELGVGVGLSGNPLQVANQCSNYGAASPGGYTACLASVTTPNNSVKSQTATLMADGGATGGGQSLSKGRLNFTTSPWSGLQAHHIITLIDSQPALTQSTWTYRPPASANDTWIGTDVSGGVGPSSGQLAFGAPVSITNYIRATGDGVHTNWLERLTSKQKTFAVPVTVMEGNSFTLGNGSPLSQMKIYNTNMPANRVAPQSCVDLVGKVGGLTKLDQITGITPPAKLGNLSLDAYASGADAILLHFCNPSGLEVITPPGTYWFLAVR